MEYGWENIPDTQIEYYCNQGSTWALDYSYDTSLPSFAFTKNINKLIITCNADG